MTRVAGTGRPAEQLTGLTPCPCGVPNPPPQMALA
jgi:hypothetical protein